MAYYNIVYIVQCTEGVIQMDGIFKVASPFEPTGDQPEAIAGVVESVRAGNKFTTLIGVTGSGKTYTMAKVIEQLQRPALIIAHNKTLAAQLCNEYKEFFPSNLVEFFVSYYDYYQPEAYIPYTNTYIEKDATVNQELDRLRHSATQAVLLRRDVVVVASVSSIYGLGSPDDYESVCLKLDRGMEIDRDELLLRLAAMQYNRTEGPLECGFFRVRGGTLEIMPSDRVTALRIDFFGDEIERIQQTDPATANSIAVYDSIMIFPATHYVLMPDRMADIAENIDEELQDRYTELMNLGKEMEAKRLLERVRRDVELIREMGFCPGVENYSRHFDNRSAGEAPYTLIDYFPDDLVVIIDESHVSIPQIRAMFNGDHSRKSSLVDFGFRLPSAYDNRPLSFDEFIDRAPQIIFVSATPGPYEYANSQRIVEQIIRPTGLLDPLVEIRPIKGQMASLLGEINAVTSQGERVLVTTLTKKMAEELTEYLLEKGVKARYMHSDIETLDRIQIIYDLRRGAFDVLVGINLLREGLDIPEVSLVAILDADKEGFLRSATTMIQTMGRAARNLNGRVILFADRITNSMKIALDETSRRRSIQSEHNQLYDITPRTIIKSVQERFETSTYRTVDKYSTAAAAEADVAVSGIAETSLKVAELERRMWDASNKLDFETAAAIRDQIVKLSGEPAKKQTGRNKG